MKFLSIKEFFYKLNTIGFILLLVPLSAFIFLYYRPGNFEPMIQEEEKIFGLLEGAIVILLLVLTVVHWLKKFKIRKLKTLIELAKKMDGYAEIFLFRMALYSACSLMMVLGYFITGSLFFTGLFIFIVIITFLQWPVRSSFSRLLALNANERVMIMSNGDTVQKKKRVVKRHSAQS